jgi:hypothetical protein
MIWARIPYRWGARPFTNIKWIIEDLFWYGPRNVIRWLPKIWLDADFDYSYLLKLMEYKLSRMADVQAKGFHLNRDRSARQMKVCAALCKRLSNEDSYYRNADKVFPMRGKWWSQHITNAQKQDQQMLGKIIGKYITHWWD